MSFDWIWLFMKYYYQSRRLLKKALTKALSLNGVWHWRPKSCFYWFYLVSSKTWLFTIATTPVLSKQSNKTWAFSVKLHWDLKFCFIMFSLGSFGQSLTLVMLLRKKMRQSLLKQMLHGQIHPLHLSPNPSFVSYSAKF